MLPTVKTRGFIFPTCRGWQQATIPFISRMGKTRVANLQVLILWGPLTATQNAHEGCCLGLHVCLAWPRTKSLLIHTETICFVVMYVWGGQHSPRFSSCRAAVVPDLQVKAAENFAESLESEFKQEQSGPSFPGHGPNGNWWMPSAADPCFLGHFTTMIWNYRVTPEEMPRNNHIKQCLLWPWWSVIVLVWDCSKSLSSWSSSSWLLSFG